MLFRDSALLDRIFKVLDTDNDGLIDFNQYIACLSKVSNKALPEDKLKCMSACLSFVLEMIFVSTVRQII